MYMYVESNGYKFVVTFTIIDVSQIYTIVFACYCKVIDTFVIAYSLRLSSDLSPIKTMLSYLISSLVRCCAKERKREGGGGRRDEQKM